MNQIDSLDALEQLLETAGVGVWRWEAKSRTMRWSRWMLRLLEKAGLDPGTGEVFYALVHPEDLARTKVMGRAMGASDQPVGVDFRMRMEDGSYAWFEGRGRLLVDPQGQVIAHEGAVTRITSRSEAEVKHRETQEMHRLFTELATDYVYVHSFATEAAGPTVVAGSFERVTGWTAAEVEARGGWMSVMHPDDRVQGAKLFDTLQQGKAAVSEYRIIDASGQTRWLRDRIVPMLDPNTGELLKLMGGVTDITERKQLEQQLLQAQKLEALARLAGGVAHDFNNLFHVVFGCVELLKRAVANGRPPEPDTIESLENVSTRASELTRSLLAFGRKQVSVRRPTGLIAALRGALPMLEGAVGEQVQVVLELPDHELTSAVDPGQLQLVLLNLCVNARDAMPGGGTVRLRLAQETLDEASPKRPPELAPGEWVRLDVVDQGSGMSAEVRRQLFEPFFTTKPQGAGTGLGLSTSHGIVRQWGGTIGVDTTVGKGSTFSLYLPSATGADVVPATNEMRAVGAGTERILVVEDDPAVRRVVVKTLRDLGYRVRQHENAESVLAGRSQELQEVDLVLTDVSLPGLDGISMCRELEQRRGDLKFLVMSGYVAEAAGREELSSGRYLFIGKPFTSDGLARRVREALDGEG